MPGSAFGERKSVRLKKKEEEEKEEKLWSIAKLTDARMCHTPGTGLLGTGCKPCLLQNGASLIFYPFGDP